eukprot:scaffold61080_cov51-Phaeocystis_antarctica.AAC.1
MAAVDARSRGVDPASLQYEVVGSLQVLTISDDIVIACSCRVPHPTLLATPALPAGGAAGAGGGAGRRLHAAAFMWEKFTTKPLVDSAARGGTLTLVSSLALALAPPPTLALTRSSTPAPILASTLALTPSLAPSRGVEARGRVRHPVAVLRRGRHQHGAREVRARPARGARGRPSP